MSEITCARIYGLGAASQRRSLQINLTKSVSFVDFKGLSIIGEGGASLVTIFCSSSGAGLEFVNVSGVSLRNVNLTGCGSARNVRRFDTPLVFIQLSALHALDQL